MYVNFLPLPSIVAIKELVAETKHSCRSSSSNGPQCELVFLDDDEDQKKEDQSSSLMGKRRKRRRKNTNLETMLILRESNRGQRQELGLEKRRKRKFGLRTSNMS
ncbi:hypothetical protein LXL04_016016 [Taraxacum kok-saghyz]